LDQTVAEIEAALARGDRPRAIGLAEAALLRGLEFPLAYNLRALKAETEGRWADAALDLEKAVRLAPSDPGIHNTLGLVYSRQRRHSQAIAAFSQAVAVQPDFHPAWRNLGLSQIAAGDVFGARASLTRASDLAPSDVEPKAQLAALAARRGDWSETARLAQAALALQADHPTAVRSMAEMELRSGQLERASERLETWLSAWRGPGATRRLLLGLLADVRDRQGRSAEAFALYQRGNAETRERARAGFGGDGLKSALQQLTTAACAATPGPFAARSFAGGPTTHIFLMGFMRSGTTLLEQALAVREDVVTLEEQEVLFHGVARYLSTAGGLQDLASASQAELDRYRQHYWAEVRANGVDPADKVLVDKLPFNGVKLPLIRRLFPDAPIVFSIRDPRDVVLSCFRQRFAINPYTYQLLDLEAGARLYNDYMMLVETYLQHLDVPLVAYRHEDLVDDYLGQLQGLCAYMRLPWCEAMSDVGLRVREGRVSSPSAIQLREGLSRDGLQTWRRYEAQIAPILPVISRWVSAFGYGPDGRFSEPWSRVSLRSSQSRDRQISPASGEDGSA
jgi:Flp pilus assembly protein TadD